MKIIHTRVNELVEEKTPEELAELGAPIPQDKINLAFEALAGNQTVGYTYFNKELLQNIGVTGVDREVIINFAIRDVVDINGIEYKGNMLHRLSGWENITYQNRNTEPPEFILNKKNYGLNATISIENIEYKGNVSKGTVSYRLYGETQWKQITGTEIPITVSGTYEVMLTDSAGNSAMDTIEVTLANKPKIDSGMVPVVYRESLNAWVIADENGGDWYDYSSDKAQWANIMLEDGLTVEGDIEVLDDNKTILVGKKVTAPGSMFVWIPRYMYQIPVANYHTSTAGEINIKFLKGTTNIATDGTNVQIANASGGDNWNVHPAFCDGNKTSYANGEWDKDITGIWVAKFEASSSNPSATNGGGNTTELNVKVLPNITSWRGITGPTAFAVSRNMVNSGNIYGLSSKSDSHMIKNSEWGMVAYLTQSKHGQIRDEANGRVWNNPNSNYITGQAGTGANTASTSTSNNYNEDNGPKASTTANVYGIYDMVGGAFERTAAYLENSTMTRNFLVGDKKYIDIYIISESEGDRQSNFNANSERYGDAIYETSTGRTGESNTNSWHGAYSDFGTNTYYQFIRGRRIGKW